MRDFVVLPLSPLLEFFGEVALTPFGSDEDCAPKAEKIVRWLEDHDLSDAYLGTPLVPEQIDGNVCE